MEGRLLILVCLFATVAWGGETRHQDETASPPQVDSTPVSPSPEAPSDQELKLLLGDEAFRALVKVVSESMADRADIASGTEADRDTRASEAILYALAPALKQILDKAGNPGALYEQINQLKSLLKQKYPNSFLSGENGVFTSRLVINEPPIDSVGTIISRRNRQEVKGSELSLEAHLGPFGSNFMQVVNELSESDLNGQSLQYRGYFSPVQEGDSGIVNPADFRGQGERAWMAMTFDTADDPSKELRLVIPTPAQDPTPFLNLSAGEQFYWVKRGPGPTAAEIRIGDEIIGPNHPKYEVVHEGHKTIVRRKKQ